MALATPEFLPYFDYFARFDLGEDYLEHADEFYIIGPKFRKLMNSSGKWFRNIDQLSSFDFEDEQLNKIRDQIVDDATRGYTKSELKQVVKDTIAGIPVSVKLGDGTRSIGAYLQQKFQQIVYTLNQPAAARLYQSIFWNIGYFDEGYFNGIFGDFRFPDGTPMKWESLKLLQKFFMKWFNNERTKAVLTFPVESFSLLTDKDTKEFKDKDSADFVAEMYSEGYSFFTYLSDNPDALSSCCRLRNEVSENQFSLRLGWSYSNVALKSY